jgi:hypothetical protein
MIVVTSLVRSLACRFDFVAQSISLVAWDLHHMLSQYSKSCMRSQAKLHCRVSLVRMTSSLSERGRGTPPTTQGVTAIDQRLTGTTSIYYITVPLEFQPDIY